MLAGARPEEIADWQAQGPDARRSPRLSFAASADAQGAGGRARRRRRRGASPRAAATRSCSIDGLDGLHPQAARRALAAARNLREGGSLTVIATAHHPVRRRDDRDRARPGELTSTGRQPILDLATSSTLRVGAARGRGRTPRRSAQARAAAHGEPLARPRTPPRAGRSAASLAAVGDPAPEGSGASSIGSPVRARRVGCT